MKKSIFLAACLATSNFIIAGNPGTSALPQPVDGHLYFSTKPFGNSSAGSQQAFKSSDFIYGRMELNSTIREVFKVPNSKTPFLQTTISIMKNGEELASERGSLNHFLLKESDLSSKSMNFDVLPDPGKATTIFSALEDFSAGNGFFPLYNIVSPEAFPSNGKYTVHVTVYRETVNAWGSLEESDKWPTLEGEFELDFNEADIATLQANKKKVVDVTRENAFRYEKMPDVFSHPGALTDPKATAAKISAILKRDLPERTILKFAAEKVSGLQWNVANDDYGLPKYRYFTPDIYVAYKMNGKCYIGTVTLREVYTGGGTFGPLQVAFTSASEQPDRGIDCALVK
jgi:hypothetical protein